MVKMGKGGLKIMRLLHGMSAAVWLGMVVSIAVLAVNCFSHRADGEFIAAASQMLTLYAGVKIVALLVLIQGVIYGLFTHWGFWRHKWVLAKWALWPPLMAMTSGFAEAGIRAAVERVSAGGAAGDGRDILPYIAAQLAILLAMFLLSAFKPFRRKRA